MHRKPDWFIRFTLVLALVLASCGTPATTGASSRAGAQDLDRPRASDRTTRHANDPSGRKGVQSFYLLIRALRLNARVVGNTILEFFPEIQIIAMEAAALEMATTKSLPVNLARAGFFRQVGFQAHHLVPRYLPFDEAEAARVVLRKFDLSINSVANGVNLPAGYHVKIHTKAEMKALLDEIKDANSREELVQTLAGDWRQRKVEEALDWYRQHGAKIGP